MKYSRLLVIILSFLLGASCAHIKPGVSRTGADHSTRVQKAIEEVKPAIVRIEVVVTSDRQGRKVKRKASGSGVIISSDGYVVTNHHVAGNASYIQCTLSDRKTVEADLIGTDALTDTTVLKLREERPYPYASFGDSSKLLVGDEVLALGSPMALSQSVTRGIVSNTELIMPQFASSRWAFQLNGEDVGSVVRWIGHDAAIYSGNSGGPLINLDGEIIGINEINLGLGGAIPGNLVRDIANEIIENKYVRRSWFGFQMQPLLRSSEIGEGVLLSGLVKNSPAYKAGFEAGDILLSVKGNKIHARFAEELPIINKFLMSFPIGEEVKVELLRNGEKKVLSVITEERERRLPDSYEAREWGFTYRELSFFDIIQHDLETREGIIVTSVRPGGASADARPDIKSNDLILQVNNQTIGARQDFIGFTNSLGDLSDSQVPVLVRFKRDKEEYLTVVEVGTREPFHSPRVATRSWFPFETQVLTSKLAAQKDLEDATGVRITRIYQNLLPEEADIKVGDIITALDGERIRASSEPEDARIFINMVRQYRIGTDIELSLIRNGETKNVFLKTLRTPLQPREMDHYSNPFFEFTLREISPQERIAKNWDEEISGVIVDEVVSGSWAALADIDVGDLILQINDQKVPDIEKAQMILENAQQEKQKAIVLKILRNADTIYLEILPDWEIE